MSTPESWTPGPGFESRLHMQEAVTRLLGEDLLRLLTTGFGPEGRMLRRTMHIRLLTHRVRSPPSIEALPKRHIRPRFWLPRTKRDSSNGRLSNVCRERS